MGSEPLVEDWEQTFGADLLPHLVPAGQLGGVRQPPDVTWLPPGSLLLRSAGLELGIELRSRRTVAAASEWLGQVLSDHDHSGTGS